MKSVKRIIWYVHKTTNLGIWFSKECTMSLVGYSGTDWVGNIDIKKCTSGGCFYLGSNLVSWYIKKKASILLSTTEVGCIVARSCCAQFL